VPLRVCPRVVALALLLSLVGCSSDAVYGPQTFFPGSSRTSWDNCQKFNTPSPVPQVCAGFTLPQGGLDLTPIDYTISFFLPEPAYVRISVFNAKGALVKLLLEGSEPAVDPQANWPTVVWNFTDAAGQRVATGDYRIYFRAGDFVTSSDVAVP
jgi:hypothetical protein